MRERGDERGLTAWLAVLQAQAAVVERLEGTLEREAGISLAWFEVLLHLSGDPEGRLRMADLARSLIVSKSGVTRLVDRMEEAGMVRRGSCAEDRRVTYTVITAAGRAALARSLPVHHRAVADLFTRHLNAGELTAVRAALGKVIAANGFAEPPCITSVASVADSPGGVRRRRARVRS